MQKQFRLLAFLGKQEDMLTLASHSLLAPIGWSLTELPLPGVLWALIYLYPYHLYCSPH